LNWGGAVPALRAREKRYYDRQDMWDRLFAPLRIYLGIERLSLALSRNQSKRVDEEFLYLDQQPKYREVVEAENKLLPQSGEQVRAAGNLGDRPLIVLTAGRPYDPEPMLTADQLEKQREIWINVLQAEEARLSTRGKQIVVADSGHGIPGERPDAVVSAIREAWLAAGGKP
jgi:pimeloyl-ACP methyl ester carboxylesterase